MLKERGIILSGEMVRATLDDRKTQTRRVIRPQPEIAESGRIRWRGGEGAIDCFGASIVHDCPYGKPGDRLWVRETTREDLMGSESMTTYVADGWSPRIRWDYSKRTRPAIHLPKKYARLWLEVTGIRVERVRHISSADCIAEGLHGTMRNDQPVRDRYRDLWDSLNAKRGYAWDANPWVWVITFERLPK